MSKLKIAAVLAIIIGPVLMVMAYLEKQEQGKIAKEGIETLATPVEKAEHSGRKGRKSYSVNLEYKDEAGATKTTKMSISKELYLRVDRMPILKIKYLKADPSKMIIVGHTKSNSGGMVGGLVVFLLGIGGTWFFFMRRGASEE